MEANLKDIMSAMSELSPAPKQEEIWMSRKTVELIPEGSKEQDYLSQFTAMQVRIDDSLPYMYFETTSQREERLKLKMDQ